MACDLDDSSLLSVACVVRFLLPASMTAYNERERNGDIDKELWEGTDKRKRGGNKIRKDREKEKNR